MSLVYYGLSLSTSELPGGNDYLNLTLSGLVEIPGFLFCYFFMDRIGRRFSLCISMFGSGVACIGAAFVPAGVYSDILIQELSNRKFRVLNFIEICICNIYYTIYKVLTVLFQSFISTPTSS